MCSEKWRGEGRARRGLASHRVGRLADKSDEGGHPQRLLVRQVDLYTRTTAKKGTPRGQESTAQYHRVAAKGGQLLRERRRRSLHRRRRLLLRLGTSGTPRIAAALVAAIVAAAAALAAAAAPAATAAPAAAARPYDSHHPRQAARRGATRRAGDVALPASLARHPAARHCAHVG